MWSWNRRLRAWMVAALALAVSGSAAAEIKLVEANGWMVSTDGRVNGFVSHVWGDDRPDGLESLPWVGFNETGDSGQTDGDGKLRKTRVRSGFVPSTFALNVHRQLKNGLKLSSRIEIGIQIANVQPTDVAEPTWMDPRSAYLELEGVWGSFKAGRDLSLFSRGNLLMNYELGHAYGVGFPCSYEKIFGGACGHVGFGTLWPDFRAQLTYSTPLFGDIFQASVGIFDPRTVPTYAWTHTPLPRVEGEATAKYNFREGWGFKGWANTAWQQVGIGVDTIAPGTSPPQVTGRKLYTQDAYGVGGGVIGYLGPVKIGGSGYLGKGMDAFEFLTFNPIFVSRLATLPNEQRRFRPTRGFLAEASVTIGSTWVMGGWGQAQLDRMASDTPIDTPNEPPLLRSQTGISTGIFHRIDAFVLGLDYFNARYGFDAHVVQQPVGTGPISVVNSKQVVHAVNAGATFEW
jgi:predicted porin